MLLGEAALASDQLKSPTLVDFRACNFIFSSFIPLLIRTNDLPNFDSHRGFVKCGIYIINWNRVMGICRVAADINNHGQAPLDSCFRNLFRIYEKGYLRCEIYAIDEYVNVKDFLKWTTFGSLFQIPLNDIISTKEVNKINPLKYKKKLTLQVRFS